MAALARVRTALSQDEHALPKLSRRLRPAGARTRRTLRRRLRFGLPTPAALQILCTAFALSPFERDILLLCAGMELDASFPHRCAIAQGDPGRSYPTFALALSVLPDAHWSALSPDSPLRRFHLIQLAGSSLTQSPLGIDESVLHYLAGAPCLDERLRGVVELMPVHPLRALPDVYSTFALAFHCSANRARGDNRQRCSLYGGDSATLCQVAALSCMKLRQTLYCLRAATFCARR